MTQDEIIEMAYNLGIVRRDVAAKFVETVMQFEREACAKDAEWCIQNYIEQHIPERIRARGSSFAATSND